MEIVNMRYSLNGEERPLSNVQYQPIANPKIINVKAVNPFDGKDINILINTEKKEDVLKRFEQKKRYFVDKRKRN